MRVVLEHSDRQQQQKQARLFAATDNTAHTPHDAAYASGGGYFEGHGVPTNDRARGQQQQANRQQPLGRGLMEYSDSSNSGYHGQHGQDPSLASQQQPTGGAGGGMAGASMDGLPILSPTHPLHPDAHGQQQQQQQQASPFSHMSLLHSGNAAAAAAAVAAAAHKSLSGSSLDSVPMGLGPPGSPAGAMISHPNYGSVATYMSATAAATTPTMSNKGSATNTVCGAVTRPTPPPRSQSTHTGGQKPPKKRRTRTSSMTSSSSIASSGIMNSITSTLGATNISYTEPFSGMHAAHGHYHQHHHQHHDNHHHPHHSSSLPNLSGSMSSSVLSGGSGAEFPDEPLHGLSIITGGGSPSTTSSVSPTTGKPRPGGHPRSAVAARVFECSFPGCNKAYTQLHNLKSHERTGHTPIQKPRPFLCIIPGCTKAFSQRKSLASHIRASHKEYKFKPFKCSQQGCDKSYTQLHNLRTHEKTVHMLDLSRKRIRNPVPYSGPGSDAGGSGGGLKMEGDGSSMMMSGGATGFSGSSSTSSAVDGRDHFSTEDVVGLSYESIGDLKDFGAVRRGGERRGGPAGGGEDEGDQGGLGDLKEEDGDDEDDEYADE
ncbi:hypothetical protein BGX24_012742 [Mortierella sp. AD032]|nr:hypothetical protein BGX24_012742 [Mortierella sp. AD032]